MQNNNESLVFLDITKLGLPEDVIKNSGNTISLNGELTGDSDEIVVINQLKRKVYSANVCHLSNGYESRESDIPCKVICDIPGFPKMVIKSYLEDVCIQTINGVKYTMACLIEKDYDTVRPNWLW